MLDRITSNLNFHGEALQLRSKRQQVLSSNIANADTPNFKARDFDFSKALRQATQVLPSGTLSSGATIGPATGGAGVGIVPGTPAALSLAAPGVDRSSAARHLPLAIQGSALGADPGRALEWRTPTQPSIDNNTVDMDRERANFAENSLRYEATIRFINGNVRNTISAIRGE